MKLRNQALLIFVCSSVLAGLSAVVNPKRPSFPNKAAAPGEVELSEVENWHETLVWVDARPESDYQKEHVPGAISLNPDNWSDQLPQFLDAWRPPTKVIVYCSAASCDTSREIADRLRKSGADPVYYLKGGWESWKEHSVGK